MHNILIIKDHKNLEINPETSSLKSFPKLTEFVHFLQIEQSNITRD